MSRVLPQDDSGVFVVSMQRGGKRWKDQPRDSLEAAVRQVETFSAMECDVYFALATFERNQAEFSRCQERAVSLRALRLDVDVGANKPFSTQDEAADALSTFCTEIGLPTPLTVSSGSGGLHVYFPFEEAVARDKWQRLANMLQSLCTARGFDVDPSCTTDAARVLRPVGTRNWKDKSNPRLVTLLNWGEVTPLAGIETILDRACARFCVPAASTNTQLPQSARAVADVIAANAHFMTYPEYRPSSAHVIADHCAQIRALRDGDHQSEPTWRASLAVIRCTVESDAIAHEWSAAQDARYTREETDGKLARLRETAPTLCTTFAKENPAGCHGCPHRGKVNSPIALGYVQRSAADPLASIPPLLHDSTQSPVLPTQTPGAAEVTPAHGAAFTSVQQVIAPLFDIETARVGRFIHTPPPVRVWLLENCLPRGVVGAIVAPGGAGKTQAMLQLSVAVAAGIPFFDTWNTGAPGEVLALLAEDDDPEIHRRLNLLAQYFSAAHPTLDIKTLLDRNLYVKSVVGENNLLTTAPGYSKEVQQTDRVTRIIATAQQLKNLKLLIVDPASRFRGGGENTAEDVTRFIEALERIRNSLPGVTVIIVHHTNKWSGQSEEQTQGAARGSSAFTDGVRFQMNLAALNTAERKCVPAGEHGFYLSATVTKNNYARPQSAVYLKRGDGGVLTKATLGAGGGTQGGDVLLDIVARVRESEPMSANTFEEQFGGKSNLFGIGKNALRGYLNQTIEAGLLAKEESGREKRLIVTDAGLAALSIKARSTAANTR